MRKFIRRKVASFELIPNDNPETAGLWPLRSTAILECGHRISIGTCKEDPATRYQPKRMACAECGIASIDGVKVAAVLT